jgi:hypothetical protein
MYQSRWFSILLNAPVKMNLNSYLLFGCLRYALSASFRNRETKRTNNKAYARITGGEKTDDGWGEADESARSINSRGCTLILKSGVLILNNERCDSK